MILSYAQIEEIAVAVILDFTAYLANSYTKPKSTGICATPIERLAKEYLGLTIAYVPLPSKYDFCGLTAYVDTEYKYEEDGQIRTIPMKQNQILLNTSFLKCGPASKLKGKHRFTIAHESAHQLLYQMEDDAVKTACKQKYSARVAYTYHELKTREDWNEWQANVLAAALLMPQAQIDLAMHRYAKGRALINYGGHFTYMDNQALSLLCNALEVSKTAAIIRLRQLGYIEDRPLSEFVDPLEVWP